MGLLDDLVSKHVKRRELLQQDKPGLGLRKMQVRPFITVSREAGTGGRLIAQLVAKKLGFKIYHKEIIEMTAKKAKKRKALIESLDEKERGFMDDLVHSLLNPEYVSEQTFIKSLCEVILSVARKGNCVILGRGGAFITGQYGGLHVRIIAPFLVRAGFTSQYEGYTLYEARERVKKWDKNRKQFIRQYFGASSSSANNYDLVINTTYLSVEQAVDIIVLAFKKKYPDWQKYKA
jgi:cytidylate kinase